MQRQSGLCHSAAAADAAMPQKLPPQLPCSTPMGPWCPTSSRLWILMVWLHLSLRPPSLLLLSREWRQRWHQQQRPWQQQMRRIMVRPSPRHPIHIQGRARARAMRARMAVIVVGGSGKDTTGVVHANIGQKLLICYPLRVFTGDQYKVLNTGFRITNYYKCNSETT
jgi:hypothetical protein